MVNAALDPIFIFVLDLELTGAALASVCARITIGIMSIYPVFRHHGGLDRPKKQDLALDIPPLFAIALPAILTQFATPVGQAYVTRMMAGYGEEAVAGMAIVGRLVPVAFAVIFALSGAIGPIVGQNFGAGKIDRVQSAIRDGFIFVFVVTASVSLILFGIRGPLADLFNATGLSRELVFLFCGPLAFSWFFNGIIFVTNASFNNLGYPFYSTWINWGRQTLGIIPFVMLGASLWGAAGVLIGQAVGGVIFSAVALVLSARVIANAKQGTASSTAQDAAPFQRQSRLMSLFRSHR